MQGDDEARNDTPERERARPVVRVIARGTLLDSAPVTNRQNQFVRSMAVVSPGFGAALERHLKFSSLAASAAGTGQAERDRCHVPPPLASNRRYLVARKKLRKKPHHYLVVFQHAGDAGRNAQIVFQYVEFTRAGP
jgi:hypothetical protein